MQQVSLLVALVTGVMYLYFSWFIILQCGKMWQQRRVPTGVFAHAGGQPTPANSQQSPFHSFSVAEILSCADSIPWFSSCG